jgi:hypothetical protein
MELTSENVESVVLDCLYRDEELDESSEEAPPGAVLAEGILRTYAFHPARLKTHEEDIASMLSQLPATFKEGEGGGMSFLQAAEREDGVQWGEHREMEALFALGIAVGKVKPCMPRPLWRALPGGMPYYVVKK